MRANTVKLPAGKRSDGSIAYEEVLVEPLGNGRYRTLATPGLVGGLAAGDEFEVLDSRERRSIKVLRRGGNIGIQFFPTEEHMVACEAFLREKLLPLGGHLDGRHRLLLVWTIPARAGFPAVEEVLREAERQFPGSEWMYSNVYAEDGTTLLNWW